MWSGILKPTSSIVVYAENHCRIENILRYSTGFLCGALAEPLPCVVSALWATPSCGVLVFFSSGFKLLNTSQGFEHVQKFCGFQPKSLEGARNHKNIRTVGRPAQRCATKCKELSTVLWELLVPLDVKRAGFPIQHQLANVVCAVCL